MSALASAAISRDNYVGGHAAIADSRFRAARIADLAKLGAYERQDGQAGLEETFAESGARFIAGEPGFPGDWPALHAFWLQGLYANGRPEMEPSPPAAGVALGTAELLDDGAIELGAESEKRGNRPRTSPNREAGPRL